ncbi:MAG: flagellar hook assembly protein FlgD [Rhodoferax sp.]|nr:flagellar hook assembly protein FlgD [Betaproteobacteria bacterium]NCN98074.1 flagellar hook assembly protein FlgD [Rhodoferax sp.]NCP82081.1 flagellar hook assembly protein FlgD [Rhodoferax sp.]NCS60154.1 flagellar hook assembly protein FlgD [Rhodoferax sp.]
MLTATAPSTVTSSSAVTSGANSSTSATSAAASQDRFLKLLVAQLNNQDPLNPVDNAQMTSQMAQINTVTGIQQVNDTLKSMTAQFTALQVLQGANMVGHDVLIDSETLSINNGVAGGAFDLAGNAESVKVDIMSTGGQIVDTLNLGALEAGRHNFEWDASTYQGTGNPSFKITATLGEKPIVSSALARALVQSVSSDNGIMKVQLAGRSAVPYSSIQAIL